MGIRVRNSWWLHSGLGVIAFTLLALAVPARPVRAPDTAQAPAASPLVAVGGDQQAEPLPDSPTAVVLPALEPAAATPQSYQLYFPSVDISSPPAQGDLSSSWILMVDDSFIAAHDVARSYHAFQKYVGNPILRARRASEGSIIQLYGTVHNGFRMWYSSYNPEWRYGQVLYAESADGIRWRRPELPGQTGNALFGGQSAELVSVMHTPNDRERPYKLVAYQNGAFWGYSSPDGIRVTPVSSAPLWNNGGDMAHFNWNAAVGRYEATTKEVTTVNEVRRRVIRLLASDDFMHWTIRPELFTPDAQDDAGAAGLITHFYGMPVFQLGRQRVGLLWILKARDAQGLYGAVHVQLATSADGAAWTREEAPRPAILDVGAPGAWDAGQVYTASQPIKVGSELWLYYSGCNLEHGEKASDMVCSIGLATLPYLRLASLEGSGTVLTAPVSATGGALRLNYAAPQGEIRVELQRDGAPIPGYEAANCVPLSGDSLDAPVVWQNQAGLPEGSFQVMFTLKDAAVFAFTP